MTSELAVGSRLIPMRSFGGCDTCRRRHVKCDETRPSCLLCRDAGVTCTGYAKSIIFDRGDLDASGTSRFRRTISTERERQAMSRALTKTMPPSLALRRLAELDEECERVASTHEVQVRRGPFGAFRLGQTRCPSTISPRISQVYASPRPTTPGVLTTSSDSLFPCDPIVGDLAIHKLLSLDPTELLSLDAVPLDAMLPVPGLSPPDSLQFMDPPSLELVQTPYLSSAPLDLEGIDWTFESASSLAAQRVSQARKTVAAGVRPALASRVSAIPPNITVLIHHYSTRVLDLLTPFRHTKTPWHIMFVPQAKRCVAALALGETVDHASLCTFYSILTVSAFSLGGIAQAPSWIQEAKAYEQSARQECASMLKTAYNTPKAAKYKYILMALISMIQVSLCLSRWQDADYYFLEAEKFIRLRGLKRLKSRKVRLLHHCYVFWRMLHESTYIGGQPSGHRRRVIQAIQSSELSVYSRDSLSFRLPKWTDLEKEMKEVKAQEVGENDLHNEHPGAWPSTLYPEIFGIPEPWLFLLSLIIRLGKEKDASEHNGNAPDALPLAEFLTRAKTIENALLHLHRQHQADYLSLDDGHDHDRSVGISVTLHCSIDAALHAIQIFFYRRIYDLQASLLQQKVQAVLDCLSHGILTVQKIGLGQDEDGSSGHGLAGFVWPAFIAACEAEGAAMQAAYASWFQEFARVSGLQVFEHLHQIMARIWKEKARAAGRRMTWTELISRAQRLSAEIGV